MRSSQFVAIALVGILGGCASSSVAPPDQHAVKSAPVRPSVEAEATFNEGNRAAANKDFDLAIARR